MILKTAQLQASRLFFKELSQLLKSGLSLHQAISIMTQDPSHRKLKTKINTLHHELNAGKPFQICIQPLLPNEFPAQLTRITVIPNIEEFLGYLENLLEKKIKFAYALQKQITYPIILLFTLLALGIGFITIILPTYTQFFANSGLPIPKSILFLQKTSQLIKGYGLILTTLLSSSAYYLFFHKKTGVSVIKKIYPQTPGEELWILGILLKSGIPLIKSLHALNISPNTDYFKDFQETIIETQQSGSLCKSIQKTKLLSPKYLAYLTHAERTHTLADSLINIGLDLINDKEKKIEILTSTIQPILLVLIGIGITLFTYMSFVPILKSLQNL